MGTPSISKTSKAGISLQQSWYAGAWWLQLLRPLSWVFRILAGFRRALYLRKQKNRQYSVPLVVVGNITVGGSGKTPLLLALAEELRSRGNRVAIVSRGYGGRATRFPLRVDKGTSAVQCGDEPAMLAKRLSLPVVVDPVRSRAVNLLETDQEYLCDVILSDDGLQHYAMGRDMEIVVVDAARGFGNGLCLPAGPLREPLSRLNEVDFLVCNGEEEQCKKNTGLAFESMGLKASAVVNVNTGERQEVETFFRQQMVHGIAGIGNPKRFFTHLEKLGARVIEHPFPDHHHFVAEDLNFGDALPVIMTEKDAVKCREFSLRNAWYIEVRAELSDAFVNEVVDKIAAIQTERKIGVQRSLFDPAV